MPHKITQTEWGNEMCIKILHLIEDELYMDFRYLDMAVSALTLTPNESIFTIATDGISLYFPSEQIMRLFQKNPLFLNRAVLHSVFHCIFRHLWMRGQRQTDLWNLSCDIAVEWIIDSLNKKTVRRPLSGTRTRIYRELKEKKIPVTAANIYRCLLPYMETAAEDACTESTDFPDSRTAAGKDAFAAYHKASGNASVSAQHASGNMELLQELSMEFFTDDHRFWSKDPSASPSAMKAGQSWDKIGRRMERELSMRGSEAAEGTDVLKTQIQEGKSRRSYRVFLRKFTVLKEELHCDYDEFDLNYYSYGLRLYKNMPLIEPLESREVKKISEFVIVVDTSYSTNGALVQKFLEETFQIIKERDSFFHKSQIRIIQCDNKVQSDTVITDEKDIPKLLQNFSLVGGGGTDFRPAFAYINQLIEDGAFSNLRGVLYFTDGKGIFPAKKTPYETAFLFMGEDDCPDVPSWAMKLVLHEEDFLS